MLQAIPFEVTLFVFHYNFFPNCRLVTFILELKSICLLDLIISPPQWYWECIITYLHTDIILYDAINMCCDRERLVLPHIHVYYWLKHVSKVSSLYCAQTNQNLLSSITTLAILSFLFLEQSMVIWLPNWFDLHGCPQINLIYGGRPS